MDTKKEHIFLLVQSGYSAKNFILSGFLNQDNAKITFWSDQDYINEYKIDNELVKLPEYTYDGKLNVLQKLKNKAELFYNTKKFRNKHYLYYLIGIERSKSIKVKLKNSFISFIAKFYASENGIQKLDIPFYNAIRKTTYYKACLKQIKQHNPTVVFCTHQRSSSAVAPVLAARDLGLRTVCFIHSWDNIPKGVQLVKADEYFVWSAYMKNEMKTHYPFINPQHIKITGTPQFATYFSDEYRLTRDVFLSKFGLDTNKKYILFSGNDKTTSPNDPRYLKDLCDAVLELNTNSKATYAIIFRPNPIDINDGFDKVLEDYKDIVTELKPDWFGSETFVWNKGGPNKKDVMLLVNTILHSEIIVNMGSTMALDAALLDVPACYINYDVKSDFNWTVKRIYNFIHFKMIKEIDPVFWINAPNEMLSVIKEALNNPEKTADGRRKWIDAITQLPIARTNERMWNYLMKNNEV
ncbi:MAG: hypothetical protein HRT67_02570 [Flavobacteriaceae bacterium]|nr:hypothetical protein [Flavobacteriaceae bacterium]